MVLSTWNLSIACITIVLLLNFKRSLPYQKHFPTGSERLILIVRVVCGILNTNWLHQRMLFKSTRSYTSCYERYKMFFSHGISTCMLQPQILTTPGTPPHSLRSTVALSFSGNKASQSISPWSNPNTNLKQHGSLSLDASLFLKGTFARNNTRYQTKSIRLHPRKEENTCGRGWEAWSSLRSVCAWWIW